MTPTPFSIRNPPRWLALIVGCVLLLGLGLADWLGATRPSYLFVSLLILYLLPIFLVAWFVNRWAGYGMILAAALVRTLTYFEQLQGTAATTQTTPAMRFLRSEGTILVIFPIIVYLLTKLKQTQEDLIWRLAKRTAELSAAEDTERRRLATDLHDSVCQTLALVKINLARSAENDNDNQSRQSGMQEGLRLLDDAIQQTRTLMFDMYPAMLDDLGLAAALTKHGQQLDDQVGTQITISEIGTQLKLPAPILSFLFRSCKELLNNAIKHGHAKDIVVSIHWQPRVLKIIVDDDGCGFDPEQTPVSRMGYGLGLESIRERLLSLRGRLLIESQPGEGARLIMELALGDWQTEG